MTGNGLRRVKPLRPSVLKPGGSSLVAVSPMRRCGKAYSADEAPPGAVQCPCGKWHVRTPPVTKAAGTKGRAAAKPAGEFSAKVKLAVRKRAGNGDPGNASCESCGIWLGRYLGQVQHIIGRGMGGCRDEVVNSIVNAALLCGTPFTGCHGLATAFDAEIGARGFWLPRGTDPRTAPMRLAGEHGPGTLVWRSAEGGYLFERPELELAS